MVRNAPRIASQLNHAAQERNAHIREASVHERQSPPLARSPKWAIRLDSRAAQLHSRITAPRQHLTKRLATASAFSSPSRRGGSGGEDPRPLRSVNAVKRSDERQVCTPATY